MAYDTTTIETLLDATSRSVTTTGDAVDIAAFNRDLTVILFSEAGVGGGSNTVKIQESANGSTGWTDVADGAFTATAAAAQFQRMRLATRAVKRYIRAVGTVSGTWAGCYGVFVEGIPSRR